MIPLNTAEVVCSFCGKNKRQVKKLVAAPPNIAGDNIHICDKCIDLCKDIISKPVIKDTNITPVTIKETLDDYVIGQDETKVSVSVAVYNHIKRINNLSKAKYEKSNILMIGPTGTGKTLIAKTVAEAVGVPYAIVDATSLTESGYSGDDVESIIYSLCDNAEWDIDKAEKGIVFVDEVDKIAKKSDGANNSVRDVSGAGVQQALLKMVEGKVISIIHPETNQRILFDTSHILFIASGAFVGLNEVIYDRRKTPTIGFNAQKKQHVGTDEIESYDLEEYGMIPEFVGRFPIVTVLNELDEELLYKILVEPENSISSQYQNIFSLEGVDLNFDDKYFRILANHGFKKKTGARGLRSVIENDLKRVQYELPDLVKNQGIVAINVDGSGNVDYVKGPTKSKKAVNEKK